LVTINIVLPEKILEALEKKSQSEGEAVEELIIEALFKQLNIVDPDSRVELHLNLCEKYMREAEDYLAKKDYGQASEKAWGAASQMVKAVAAKEGIELRSHASLWEYVDKAAEKLGDLELRYLWARANNLHQNFYENWMPAREVELSVKDVKGLLGKLMKII